MQSKVASPFAATPDSTYGRQQSRAARRARRSADGQSSQEADVRLVIEEDEASGSYVYKTIDRRTGEVLQQIPRDAILRMQEDEDYHAGGLIRTKA